TLHVSLQIVVAALTLQTSLTARSVKKHAASDSRSVAPASSEHSPRLTSISEQRQWHGRRSRLLMRFRVTFGGQPAQDSQTALVGLATETVWSAPKPTR